MKTLENLEQIENLEIQKVDPGAGHRKLGKCKVRQKLGRCSDMKCLYLHSVVVEKEDFRVVGGSDHICIYIYICKRLYCLGFIRNVECFV